MDDASPEPRFASLDIGSHTLRLLIAQLGKGREVFPLHQERRITRLARDFSRTAALSDASMAESLAVLGEFSAQLQQHEVAAVACGATGVMRRAGNAAAFLHRIEKANGLHPLILSEEREAFLSAKGVLSGLPRPERFVLTFDLGGSSTEFMLLDTTEGRLLWSTSVFLGAATVTERLLIGDPPPLPTLVRTREAVRAALVPHLSELKAVLRGLQLPSRTLPVVGTAGTVTTLAAMSLEMRVYDPVRINGLILAEAWLNRTIGLLAETPLQERRKLAGLEKGREGIILGGALIVEGLLEALEQQHLTVVDSGLLEGLLLALIEKECGWPESLVSPLSFRPVAVGG